LLRRHFPAEGEELALGLGLLLALGVALVGAAPDPVPDLATDTEPEPEPPQAVRASARVSTAEAVRRTGAGRLVRKAVAFHIRLTLKF
jgi:hypothetical protein